MKLKVDCRPYNKKPKQYNKKKPHLDVFLKTTAGLKRLEFLFLITSLHR